MRGMGGVLLYVYKAKDTPWDAVLMGSVVCTVATNVTQLCYTTTHFTTIFFNHHGLSFSISVLNKHILKQAFFVLHGLLDLILSTIYFLVNGNQ